MFSSVRPNQVKWHLMIASCHRRSGNYQQALETYKYIHRKFPDNVECKAHVLRKCYQSCRYNHYIGTRIKCRKPRFGEVHRVLFCWALLSGADTTGFYFYLRLARNLDIK